MLCYLLLVSADLHGPVKIAGQNTWREANRGAADGVAFAPKSEQARSYLDILDARENAQFDEHVDEQELSQINAVTAPHNVSVKNYKKLDAGWLFLCHNARVFIDCTQKMWWEINDKLGRGLASMLSVFQNRAQHFENAALVKEPEYTGRDSTTTSAAAAPPPNTAWSRNFGDATVMPEQQSTQEIPAPDLGVELDTVLQTLRQRVAEESVRFRQATELERQKIIQEKQAVQDEKKAAIAQIIKSKAELEASNALYFQQELEKLQREKEQVIKEQQARQKLMYDEQLKGKVLDTIKRFDTMRKDRARNLFGKWYMYTRQKLAAEQLIRDKAELEESARQEREKLQREKEQIIQEKREIEGREQRLEETFDGINYERGQREEALARIAVLEAACAHLNAQLKEQNDTIVRAKDNTSRLLVDGRRAGAQKIAELTAEMQQKNEVLKVTQAKLQDSERNIAAEQQKFRLLEDEKERLNEQKDRMDSDWKGRYEAVENDIREKRAAIAQAVAAKGELDNMIEELMVKLARAQQEKVELEEQLLATQQKLVIGNDANKDVTLLLVQNVPDYSTWNAIQDSSKSRLFDLVQIVKKDGTRVLTQDQIEWLAQMAREVRSAAEQNCGVFVSGYLPAVGDMTAASLQNNTLGQQQGEEAQQAQVVVHNEVEQNGTDNFDNGAAAVVPPNNTPVQSGTTSSEPQNLLDSPAAVLEAMGQPELGSGSMTPSNGNVSDVPARSDGSNSSFDDAAK